MRCQPKSDRRNRHGLLVLVTLFVLALFMPGIASSAPDTSRKSLVMLPFGLVDSMQEIVPFADKVEKLQMITDLLEESFRREGFYRILSSPEISYEVERQQKRYDLFDCNGCERDIAVVAGADRVLIAWVQRATALILNVNIEISDVASGETLLRKSAEIRGDTPANWRRAVRYIVRSMVASGQGNR